MKVVNLEMLKQPINWIVVLMMLVLAATAGHLILHLVGLHPAENE